MPLISVTTSGSFKGFEHFIDKILHGRIFSKLDEAGKLGVEALSRATPVDTGLTAASWDYVIRKDGGGYTIDWVNTNENENVVIAILIQYGHGTGTGGYVIGTDYINPAMESIFQQIADDVWKEVVG